MTRRHRGVVLAAFALGACTTEQITYFTRPFNPPPDATAGFLGYFTESTKQTTCGNCHVGHQADWVTTKHADAWADLQASGHASASCNGCHTVSEKGNSTGHAAGYNAVANAAYHDVQCESCHGAGYTHVQNPEVLANRPLASIHVDTGLANGCGGCHTGVHTPFVDQWVQSAHGAGPGYAAAAANASCAPCHEGKAALLTKFGVKTNYVEVSDTTHQRIVCVVCHDPHGTAGYEGQLRASISAPTADNLCIKCHSRTGAPPWPVATATSASRGPHGAQGLLVIGQSVGWIPPNFTYDTSQIVSSHGTAANPRLCATCHVAFTTVTDKTTGAFQLQNVGHLFEAIPCTDVMPLVDIFEEPACIRLVAELPGVKPENVEIAVEGNLLTIKGNKEQAAEEKVEKVHRYERTYGAFERTFKLPATVTPEKIKATYEHGVLTVMVPKIEAAKPHLIKVEVAPPQKALK